MSEAGPLPLVLDYPSIYLFEVGAEQMRRKGGKIFCGRTHWREDLGGLPLPMQCHCRLQDPLTQVPSELENLPFVKICFQFTWQRLTMGRGQKRQFVRKLTKEAKGKKMRFNHNPPKSATYALSMQ